MLYKKNQPHPMAQIDLFFKFAVFFYTELSDLSTNRHKDRAYEEVTYKYCQRIVLKSLNSDYTFKSSISYNGNKC